MAYRVEFTRRAEREWKGLSRLVQTRLKARIDSLADESHRPGADKLSGPDNLYRIRVGDYRVIYAVQATGLLVLVIRVGHGREVYRNLFK